MTQPLSIVPSVVLCWTCETVVPVEQSHTALLHCGDEYQETRQIHECDACERALYPDEEVE
jgi:hypothetical protein